MSCHQMNIITLHILLPLKHSKKVINVWKSCASWKLQCHPSVLLIHCWSCSYRQTVSSQQMLVHGRLDVVSDQCMYPQNTWLRAQLPWGKSACSTNPRKLQLHYLERQKVNDYHTDPNTLSEMEETAMSLLLEGTWDQMLFEKWRKVLNLLLTKCQ